MAKVTFADQTSFELENGETIVVQDIPPARSVCYFNHTIELGRKVNLALTSKRLLIVPKAGVRKVQPQSIYYYDVIDVSIANEGIGLYIQTQDYNETRLYIYQKITLKVILQGVLAAFFHLGGKTLSEAGKQLSYSVNQNKVNSGELTLAKAQKSYDKDVAEFNKLAPSTQSELNKIQNGSVAQQAKAYRDYMVNAFIECVKIVQKT